MPVLTLKIMPLELKWIKHGKKIIGTMGQWLWSSIFYGFSVQNNSWEISQGRKGSKGGKNYYESMQKFLRLGHHVKFLSAKRQFPNPVHSFLFVSWRSAFMKVLHESGSTCHNSRILRKLLLSSFLATTLESKLGAVRWDGSNEIASQRWTNRCWWTEICR